MNGDFYSGIFQRNITAFVHICMYVCIFVGPFSCSEREMSTSDILSVYVGLKTTTVTITSFECDYTRHHYNPALCLLFVTLRVCVRVLRTITTLTSPAICILECPGFVWFVCEF